MEPLLLAHSALITQIIKSDDQIGPWPDRRDRTPVDDGPGVGPVTALAFASAIDDPHQFKQPAMSAPIWG